MIVTCHSYLRSSYFALTILYAALEVSLHYIVSYTGEQKVELLNSGHAHFNTPCIAFLHP